MPLAGVAAVAIARAVCVLPAVTAALIKAPMVASATRLPNPPARVPRKQKADSGATMTAACLNQVHRASAVHLAGRTVAAVAAGTSAAEQALGVAAVAEAVS